MSKHVRALRKFTAKWPTVPGSFQLSTSAEVGNFRIPITSVPAICYINTKTLSILLYAMLSHRCELFAARRSNAPNCSCSRLFILLTPPPGGGGGLVSSTPPGGSTIKAREPSSRFHSYVRESYWQHPMGFSLRKLQTSISPEPLIAQRADFAWKLIWARGIG